MAVHRSFAAILAHLFLGTASASDAFRVDPARGTTTPLGRDEGGAFSGGTSALVFEGRLYMGQLRGDGIRVCPL